MISAHQSFWGVRWSHPSPYLVSGVLLCGAPGHDLLTKAKTGTGKTLAFLLPAIESVARTPRSQRQGFSVLIISPTRELAQQITDEAKQVLVSVWCSTKIVYYTTVSSTRLFGSDVRRTNPPEGAAGSIFLCFRAAGFKKRVSK